MTAGAEVVLGNARVVLADEVITGSVLIRDGAIADVSHGATAVTGDDLDGDTLIPGLVELHTDHLESHYAPRPGVRWNPMAAVQAHDAQIAGSGITTVFDALRAGTEADSRRLGADMRLLADTIARGKREGRLRADHLLHLRCEVASSNVIEQVEPFLGDSELRLISVMDHTPGQRQFASLDKYREYYQGKTGMSDADMDAFMTRRIADQERYAAANRAKIVRMCHAHGVAVASHDDATEAHVEEAVADGVRIAEFPTTESAAAASRRAGMKVLMGAPNMVRGGSHSGNVSALALAQAGQLDILSSDYIPFSLLHAAFMLPDVDEATDLAAAVGLVTRQPAEAVGLTDRGTIAPGQRGDLVRVRVFDDVPMVRAVWRQGKRVV